ncbi:MAG: cyclopropane-fatty-acyl-phospholipid synthase family protein [Acidiferrobacterales bacterium]|nr:cyclopropane-fatty-acyl-phospholipid synthase family protein [Acidiferrobacterales bacterium]
MKISALTPNRYASASKPSVLDNLARRSLFKILSNMHGGILTIEESGNTYVFGTQGVDLKQTLSVQISVTNPAFYRMIMLRGSIGAGEAYMMGFWHASDLTEAVQLICRNMGQLEEMDGKLAKFGILAQKIKHYLSPNSLKGSKKNIHAHYDLSNDLFESFLDHRMMYSAAIYPNESANLETAATFKLQRVGEKLNLKPSDHVLEIGTGWGGLAIYLASNFGCKVTTTTISHEQYEYAKAQIKQHGLENQITLLEKDYRLLEGQFDKLVSIEMIEAVGQKYLSTYFKKCNDLLKTGGKMLIQAITIPEQRYQYARKNIDFIQRYIFPGGSLPSVEVIMKNTGNFTNLQIDDLEDIGLDYARTLEHWHQRFNRAENKVLSMGFDQTFIRLWQFYLSYCEGGFRERAISTAQIVFRKI